jgi:hypothetical protein
MAVDGSSCSGTAYLEDVVSKTCFVIMPITTLLEARPQYHDDANHFGHVLDHLFKPALQAAGYAVMGPLVEYSEVIQGEIIKNLNSADLVLCDISQSNANVFFELGIRAALDKPVALVRDNLTHAIPFDNSIVSCHEYDASLTPWCLSAEVERLQKFVCGAGKQSRNALWKYFGMVQQAAVHQEGNPISAKLDLLLSELSILRQGQAVSPPRLRDSLDRAAIETRIEGLRDFLKSATGNPRWMKIGEVDSGIIIFFDYKSRENAERNKVINILEIIARNLPEGNQNAAIEIKEGWSPGVKAPPA